MIFAEWFFNGNYDCGFFDCWDSWYDFSFNHNIAVLKVREVKYYG